MNSDQFDKEYEKLREILDNLNIPTPVTSLLGFPILFEEVNASIRAYLRDIQPLFDSLEQIAPENPKQKARQRSKADVEMKRRELRTGKNRFTAKNPHSNKRNGRIKT